MPSIKTAFPISHCKAICEHTPSPARCWGGNWGSCQGGPVACESRRCQPGRMPPPPRAAVAAAGGAVACWHGQQQGGIEKLSCPRATFNVVGFDCGLRPGAAFLAYGFLLPISTEKLQGFTLLVQAVLLKDLRY